MYDVVISDTTLTKATVTHTFFLFSFQNMKNEEMSTIVVMNLVSVFVMCFYCIASDVELTKWCKLN